MTTTKIRTNGFSGNSKLYQADEQGLGYILARMSMAMNRMLLSGQDDFTADNSGGTAGAGATGLTITDPTVESPPVAYQGTAAVSKAEADAAFDDIRNAYTTIGAQLATLSALTGVTITNAFGGTDGEGTVAAVADALTAIEGAGAADYATFVALNETYREGLFTLANQVERMRYATGFESTPLVIEVAPLDKDYGASFAALGVATGTAVDGTAADSVAESVAQDLFEEYTNNIARLVARIDDMTAAVTGFTAAGVFAEKV